MLNVVMLSVIMMSVIMLSVIMLNAVMLSVIMLNVVMLSIVAPFGAPVLPSILWQSLIPCFNLISASPRPSDHSLPVQLRKTLQICQGISISHRYKFNKERLGI